MLLYLWLASRCKKVSDNELLFKRDSNWYFKLWSLNYFFKERFSWIIWSFSFSFSTGYVFDECLSGLPFLTVKFSFFFFFMIKKCWLQVFIICAYPLFICALLVHSWKGFNPTLTLLHLIHFKSISMTSTILLILKTRVNTYWNLPFLIVLACGFCDFDNCKLWFDSFVEMFYSVSTG